MPKEANNEKDLNGGASGSQNGRTGRLVDDFENIVQKVEQRTDEKYRAGEQMKRPDPNLSESMYLEDAQRRIKSQANYERNKQSFKKIHADIQNLRRAGNSLKTRTAEERMDEAKMEARNEISGAMRKEIEGRMEKDLGFRDKMIMKVAVKTAGDKLVDAIDRTAQGMAKQVSKSEGRAFIVIAVTYLVAALKDISDVATGGLLGILTGIAAGTFLALFWLYAYGHWRGGMVTNYVTKIVLRFVLGMFIEVTPGVSIIPTYLVLNWFSHRDFKKNIRKNRDMIAELDMKKEKVAASTNRRIKSIGA